MSGKSKILQQKDLERFCSFDQNGHKITVKQIYDTPFDKVDKRRTEHHSLYVKCIESILLNFFIRGRKKAYRFTKKQLWEELGMISTNYYSNYKKQNLIDSLQVIDGRVQQWHVDKFYLRSRKKLNDITKSALKSLSDRKLIYYDEISAAKLIGGEVIEVKDPDTLEKIINCEKHALDDLRCKKIQDALYPRRIQFDSSNIDVVEVDQKGNLRAVSPGSTTITVTVDYKEEILYSIKVKKKQDSDSNHAIVIIDDKNLELFVEQEYVLKPKIKLSDDNKVSYDKYIKLRNKYLKTSLGFEYIFKQYRIVCNTEYLEQGLQENEHELKHELNNNIIKALDKQATKEFNDNRINYNENNTTFKYPDYFVEIQHLLVTRLLKLDEEQLQTFIDNLVNNPELDELSALADETFRSKSA